MKRLFYPAVLLALIVSLGGTVLIPAQTASAASSLRLSRYTAGPGDTVTVLGYGFAPQDDVVVAADVKVNGQARRLQATAATNSSGAFNVALVLPPGTSQGTVTVEARDFHGHVATQKLNILPAAFLQPGTTHVAYIIPGHPFYVNGQGFKPNESVRLTANFPLFDGTFVGIDQTVQANSKGVLSEVLLHTPLNAKPGTVVLQGTGQSSKKTGKASLKVSYRPTLTLGALTVRPGTNVRINGHEFVPGSTVSVFLSIPRGGQTVTLSKNVQANDHGNFSTVIGLPADVKLGKYRITAVDRTGGFRTSIDVTVSIHPSIKLDLTSVLPGQVLTVTGDNFGSNVPVTITGTFVLQHGGTKTVSTTTQTGGSGSYTARLAVPTNAGPGTDKITARSSNGQTSTTVQVRQRPPLPTSTPVPTATSVPATTTPVATSTPTAPHKHRKKFGFKYVSIWYHVVRVGTGEHLVVQSTLKTTQGLWVHVWFPAGHPLAYYVNTDSTGHWEKDIPVASNTLGTSNHVLVTFRLWHGGQSREKFSGFTLTR